MKASRTRRAQALVLLRKAQRVRCPKVPRNACAVPKPSEPVLRDALAICQQASDLDPTLAEVFVEQCIIRD